MKPFTADLHESRAHSDRAGHVQSLFSNALPGYKRVRNLFWCAAIVLGLVNTWALRQTMASDGVAYLDMGDAYWRGDWKMAINAHWSPMYSWLLGGALKLLKPSGYWELPVVHAVNFVIFLGALGAFEFLLGALIDYQQKVGRGDEAGLATLPAWAWCSIGYTLFLWTSFELIRLDRVTPDMLVAAFVYLAAGIVLKIRAGSTGWMTFVLFGVVLGFGYLAKAIMFPLAFVFLGVTLFSVGRLRRALPRVLVAAAVFLTVGSPFIVALSLAMGRPTIGESGRLNYIWCVDHPDLNTLPANTFKHPVKRIHEAPVVYEFAQPIKGTYPLWYDLAYWNEGLKARFDLKGQIRVLKLTGIGYYNLVFLSGGGLIAGLIILYSVSPLGLRSFLYTAREGWYLMVPAAAGLGAFLLLVVEGRYIGPYVLLLGLGVLCGVRIHSDGESRRLIAGVVLAIVVTMGAPVVSTTVLDAAEQRHKGPVDWEVAQALSQMGIQPGDKVAYIRRSPWGDFLWARLARIQIIAEIPPAEVDKFWAATPPIQSEVIQAFAKTGAKAIITSAVPPCACAVVWHKLGNTDFYAYAPRLDTRLSAHE
jgi:Fe2+ transport system protein FeoA